MLHPIAMLCVCVFVNVRMQIAQVLQHWFCHVQKLIIHFAIALIASQRFNDLSLKKPFIPLLSYSYTLYSFSIANWRIRKRSSRCASRTTCCSFVPQTHSGSFLELFARERMVSEEQQQLLYHKPAVSIT